MLKHYGPSICLTAMFVGLLLWGCGDFGGPSADTAQQDTHIDDSTAPADTSGSDAVSDSSTDGGDVSALDGVDAPDEPSPVAGTWSAEIHPYIEFTCGGCHSIAAAGAPMAGPVGAEFGDTNVSYAYGKVLTYVTPGNASTSLLFEKITVDPPTVGERMPPVPLEVVPVEKVERIRLWIEAGAPFE